MILWLSIGLSLLVSVLLTSWGAWYSFFMFIGLTTFGMWIFVVFVGLVEAIILNIREVIQNRKLDRLIKN